MCFPRKQSMGSTEVAAAPAPPLEAPEEAEIGAKRKAEEDDQFGPDGPQFRVERPLGGAAPGGAGLKM